MNAETGSIPASSPESAAEFVVASQDALFATTDTTRCDACGDELLEADESDGYGLQGNGVYVWRHGGEPRLESAPLCASCAAAIGMTALARWEIEEEEG